LIFLTVILSFPILPAILVPTGTLVLKPPPIEPGSLSECFWPCVLGPPPKPFPEAPNDGNSYLRKGLTQSWEAITDNIYIMTLANIINTHTTQINTHASQITSIFNTLSTIPSFNVSNLTDNDFLVYSTSQNAFINSQQTFTTTLSQLTDTNIINLLNQ
jgi:hypothetical protein